MKDYLEKMHLTPKQFADKIGKPYNTVYQWVFGRKMPSLLSAYMLEKATGGEVTAKELRGGVLIGTRADRAKGSG